MKISNNGRLYSNVVLRRIFSILNVDSVLNVSGWDDGDKEGNKYVNYFPSKLSRYEISSYSKDHLRADMSISKVTIDLEDRAYKVSEKFDLIFTHTVLEHVFDQENAFRIMCESANKFVVGVAPMINVLHWEETYGDYWRFTPHGIIKLINNQGFNLVHLEIGPSSSISQYIIFVAARDDVEIDYRLSTMSVKSGEVGIFRLENLLKIIFWRVIEKLAKFKI